MSYRDAVNYLYGLQKYGIKLGLEKIDALLSLLKNPHRSFLSIHIAGTNGKGSVSAMIASILTAHGYRVGLFTSPHLVSFTERMRIDNEEIAESEVIGLTEEIKGIIEDNPDQIPTPTFFEFVTAMAFLYFSRSAVDWAVVEVGMGGRLDATNVLLPEVSVITRIGLDHQQFLGSTLTDIAREKAGIIKRGVPVVSALQEREVERVIRVAAEERSADLFIYGRDFSGILRRSGLQGIAFDYTCGAETITDLFTPLAGEHQLLNACLALKVATVALKARYQSSVMSDRRAEKDPATPGSPDVTRQGSRITHRGIKEGLSQTRWSGRMELISTDPLLMIDGAHNPDAASALAAFIEKNLQDYRLVLVIGIMSDKDVGGILKPLLHLASEIIFTAPGYERAASPQALADLALTMGFTSTVSASVKEAIEKAVAWSLQIAGQGFPPLIVITGSFYTIGEAKEVLGEEAILGTLREKL